MSSFPLNNIIYSGNERYIKGRTIQLCPANDLRCGGHTGRWLKDIRRNERQKRPKQSLHTPLDMYNSYDRPNPRKSDARNSI